MGVFHNYITKSSFVTQDESILRSNYDVISFEFNSNNKFKTPFLLIKQLIFLLWYFNKYKVIVSHIAGYHTVFPSFFSLLKLKKHIIVLHGTESNVIEEIGYGLLNRKVTKYFVKFSIKNASLLLPVSQSLISQNNTYLEVPRHMGLKTVFGDKLPKTEVIHNGIDDRLFRLSNDEPKPNSFLTISSGLDDKGRFILKGVDLILKLAADFPNYTFTIVGSHKIYGYNNDLKNVNIIGFIRNDQLANIIASHQYYLQLSMSEGFGVSLCESMLCGLIPIVSNVGIMPEIIGDFGYVLLRKDYAELKEIFEKLGKNPKYVNRKDLSERIQRHYNVNLRKEKLISTINYITTSN